MYLMLLKAAPDYMISDNFAASEFICKCDYSNCNHSFLYSKTLDSAQMLRKYVNSSLTTTNGHRCQLHNSDVGGVDDSYHMKGHAVDFLVPDNMTINVFAGAATHFFDVVIPYPDKNFVHCHNL